MKTRLRFSTKQVGRGFYRGTNTGSKGAHTKYGDYLIDWRKVRHFVVPNLQGSKLSPFVSAQLHERQEKRVDPNGFKYDEKYDGMQYLMWMKHQHPQEWQHELSNAPEQQG
ncbi:60S ribosomal protein L27, mitochondrial [Lithohypha guttulata]|uniref:60S ribosomal protein L27, mitochondrial n=1 Tax=Lithohypha guttulata TaxID=1690604 RepID=A0AAN7T2A0_9EURO|nr:60S ribosomal protein L27, mitochondrial [Lithohypha guttulata]KAK5097028.1 60S ribosomal protein L27, mitochondrial [Lithohypha guttulata]